MKTVDNIDQATPTEEEVIPEGSVVNKPFTAETFDTTWRSCYVHVTETLRRVYEQVGEVILAEMSEQISEFDPDTNDEHKKLLEESVTAKVIEIGAQAELMGMLKMSLVIYLDIGKRYSFNTKDIVQSLEALTDESNITKHIEQHKSELENGS